MTIVFISGRQLGKTEEIIRWWLADPEGRVIISSSEQTAKLTRNRIKKMVRPKWGERANHLIDDSVMSFETRKNRQQDGRAVGIDDVENMLGHLVGSVPQFMTMTGQIFGGREE